MSNPLAKGTASKLLFREELSWAASPAYPTEQAITPANATNNFTLTSHGYEDGWRFKFTSGTPPTPEFAVGTWYYIINKTTDTFQLSATSGGAAITFDDDGTTPKGLAIPPSRYLSFVNEGLGGNINQLVSEEIRADRAVASIRGGNISTNGPLTTEFGPIKNGLLIKHMLGKEPIAHTDLESGVPAYVASKYYNRGQVVSDTGVIYLCTQGGLATGAMAATDFQTLGETTWKQVGATGGGIWGATRLLPGTTTFLTKGLVIEKQVRGQTTPTFIQFAGVRVNGFNLSIPQEGLARCDWNLLMMKQYKLSDTLDPAPLSPSTDQPFTGSDIVVYLKAGQDQAYTPDTGGYYHLINPLRGPLNSSGDLLTARPVREATLTFSNQFDESVFTVGDRYRRELPEGVRQITGSLTTYFEDETEFNAFLGETELTIEFCMIVGAKMMIVRLPYCKITGQGTPVISGPGVLTATYNFTAYKGGASDDIRFDVYHWASDVLV